MPAPWRELDGIGQQVPPDLLQAPGSARSVPAAGSISFSTLIFFASPAGPTVCSAASITCPNWICCMSSRIVPEIMRLMSSRSSMICVCAARCARWPPGPAPDLLRPDCPRSGFATSPGSRSAACAVRATASRGTHPSPAPPARPRCAARARWQEVARARRAARSRSRRYSRIWYCRCRARSSVRITLTSDAICTGRSSTVTFPSNSIARRPAAELAPPLARTTIGRSDQGG